MIVRIWSTQVKADRQDEYLAFARHRSRAMFLAQPGCLGVLFLAHGDGRHSACSFWRCEADVEALSSSATYQRTASDLGGSGILTDEPTVVVSAVEGGTLDCAGVARILEALT